MKNYSYLTMKYLKKHKARTLLTLSAIIIAIAMFTAIGSIYYSGRDSQINTIKAQGNYEISFKDISLDNVKLLENNAEIKNGGAMTDIGTILLDSTALTNSLRSVKIRAYDEDCFDKIFNVKLSEGRLPQNSNEVIVDKKFYRVLKEKQLADSLKGSLKTGQKEAPAQYKIVGAYESIEINSPALTLIDSKTPATGSYIYLANLKSKNAKINAADRISKATGLKYGSNDKLLYYYGQGSDKNKNDAAAIIFGFIAGFVLLCSVAVIYNAFSISVMERIKHFGILRSVGATKGQISNLVFKEAMIMCAISIPAGIACGYGGMVLFFNILMSGFLGAFKINFYPNVIIIAVLLGLLTVLLSVFLPARAASRVSPVDAIRGTMIIKGEKLKRRRGILARLFFGFEGQVAYKNIRRSRKRFFVTCLSLAISLIMFIFFSTLIDMVVKTYKLTVNNINVQALYSKNEKAGSPYIEENLVKQLNELQGIKDVYRLGLANVPAPISKDKMKDTFVDSLKSAKKLYEYKDSYIIDNTQIMAYDEKALELLNKENNLNINYDDFKNGKVIIINKATGRIKNKVFYDGFTKYKPGDTLSLPRIDTGFIDYHSIQKVKDIINKNNSLSFEVENVIEYDAIGGSPIQNGYGIIMSIESFKKLTGINGYSDLGIKFDSSNDREALYEKLNYLADENNATYNDFYVAERNGKKLINQIKILTYGFISLIVLIACVNIINSVTMNLLVKKREYAVFKAIGMTKQQFKKLILLEGTLFGIFACIIGLPLSYLISKYVLVNHNPLWLLDFKMPLWPYLVGALGIIGITFLSVLLPLRKLNDMNIVESLRLED